MYQQQQQRQFASGFFNGPGKNQQMASAASLFSTGLNQNSVNQPARASSILSGSTTRTPNQVNNFQFDSFVNDASSTKGNGPMSLPPANTIGPPPMVQKQRSGPPSLDNFNSGGNPFRAHGRRGHNPPRSSQPASTVFGGAGFTPVTFAPPMSTAITSLNATSFNPVSAATTSTPNLMAINQPEEFSQYPTSEISEDRKRQLEIENDRVRAEKIANRERNLAKVNEKRDKIIAEQKIHWEKLEKEKQQAELMNSFHNDEAPMNLVHKPNSKEDRKSIRERAKKARARRSERTSQLQQAGDLSSLIDEISSQGASICSDLSDAESSFHNSFNKGLNLSATQDQHTLLQHTVAPTSMQSHCLGPTPRSQENFSNNISSIVEQNSVLHNQSSSEDTSSGSSYVITQKSLESESRLSPYQIIDNVTYPSQSSLNSNDSSPLEFIQNIQNISVSSSSYEKIPNVATSSLAFDSSSVEGFYNDGSNPPSNLQMTNSQNNRINEQCVVSREENILQQNTNQWDSHTIQSEDTNPASFFKSDIGNSSMQQAMSSQDPTDNFFSHPTASVKPHQTVSPRNSSNEIVTASFNLQSSLPHNSVLPDQGVQNYFSQLNDNKDVASISPLQSTHSVPEIHPMSNQLQYPVQYSNTAIIQPSFPGTQQEQRNLDETVGNTSAATLFQPQQLSPQSGSSSFFDGPTSTSGRPSTYAVPSSSTTDLFFQTEVTQSTATTFSPQDSPLPQSSSVEAIDTSTIPQQAVAPFQQQYNQSVENSNHLFGNDETIQQTSPTNPLQSEAQELGSLPSSGNVLLLHESTLTASIPPLLPQQQMLQEISTNTAVVQPSFPFERQENSVTQNVPTAASIHHVSEQENVDSIPPTANQQTSADRLPSVPQQLANSQSYNEDVQPISQHSSSLVTPQRLVAPFIQQPTIQTQQTVAPFNQLLTSSTENNATTIQQLIMPTFVHNNQQVAEPTQVLHESSSQQTVSPFQQAPNLSAENNAALVQQPSIPSYVHDNQPTAQPTQVLPVPLSHNQLATQHNSPTLPMQLADQQPNVERFQMDVSNFHSAMEHPNKQNVQPTNQRSSSLLPPQWSVAPFIQQPTVQTQQTVPLFNQVSSSENNLATVQQPNILSHINNNQHVVPQPQVLAVSSSHEQLNLQEHRNTLSMQPTGVQSTRLQLAEQQQPSVPTAHANLATVQPPSMLSYIHSNQHAVQQPQVLTASSSHEQLTLQEHRNPSTLPIQSTGVQSTRLQPAEQQQPSAPTAHASLSSSEHSSFASQQSSITSQGQYQTSSATMSQEQLQTNSYNSSVGFFNDPTLSSSSSGLSIEHSTTAAVSLQQAVPAQIETLSQPISPIFPSQQPISPIYSSNMQQLPEPSMQQAGLSSGLSPQEHLTAMFASQQQSIASPSTNPSSSYTSPQVQGVVQPAYPVQPGNQLAYQHQGQYDPYVQQQMDPYWQYQQQQQWYANYYNQQNQYYQDYQQYYGYAPYWSYDQYSYHSSAASSAYGDSRPGSVVERRSSCTEENILNELNDITSEMSFNDRPESPIVEEILQRSTPLSFTRPHIKAIFSSIGGVINIVAPKQPLDGEVAFVQNVQMANILSVPMMIRFPGPLVRKETSKKKVRLFILETIRDHLPALYKDSKQLFAQTALWQFVDLLIKQNGTFDGTDVADLLISLLPSKDVQGKEIKQLSALAHPVQNIGENTLEEFHSRISTGQTHQGLEIAIASGLWGHAFMLGKTMGEDIENLVNTKFLSSLKKSDPMKTLYAHLQNKNTSYIKKRANTDTWVQNLCMLISQATNDPKRDREKIIAFGDALREQDLYAAAQICYLIAKVPFGRHESKDNQLVLLGFDHRNFTDKPARLITKDLPVQLTEIYQYACTLHDQSYTVKSFQPYKFEYALQLIEFGYLREGYFYLESIGIAINRDHTYSLYTTDFVNNVIRFAEQLAIQDAEKYDDYEQPMWIQNLKRYAEQSTNAPFTGPPPVTHIVPPIIPTIEEVVPAFSSSAASTDRSSSHHGVNDISAVSYDEASKQPEQYHNSEQQTIEEYNSSYGWTPRSDQQDTTDTATSYENDAAYDQTGYYPNYDSNPQYNEQVYDENQGTIEQFEHVGYPAENHSEETQEQVQDMTDYPVEETSYAQYSSETTPFFNPNNFNDTADSSMNYGYQQPNMPAPMEQPNYDNQEQEVSYNNHVNEVSEQEEPEEDLFSAFAKPKANTASSNKDSTVDKGKSNATQPSKSSASLDNAKQPKGWFGGLFSKLRSNKEVHLPDDQDKSLYYDETLKKWIDKNADPAEAAKPLPPPPMGMGNFGSSAPKQTNAMNMPPPGSMTQIPSATPPMPSRPNSSSNQIAQTPPNSVPGPQMMNRNQHRSRNNSTASVNSESAKQQPAPGPALNARRSLRRKPSSSNKNENEEDKKPAGPPSKFSMKAQGIGRRGTNRYVNVMGSAIKATPMAPVLDPFAGLAPGSKGPKSGMSAAASTTSNMPMTFFDPSKMSN